MSDSMVLKTQKWLNRTYGGDSRYNRIAEDGVTGWGTINALTRAMQIELGLTSTADNFGPSSQAAYSKNPLKYVNDTAQSNKYAILQGALWCKGYNPGHYGTDDAIDDHFDTLVAAAVIKLKTDAGMIDPNSDVTTNFMRALLSMDQFRLLSQYGGDAAIRSFQQELNRNYESYTGIMPCDGVYTRSTNKACILALQALEGMPVSVANGVLGPSTRKYCPTIPYNGGQINYGQRRYSSSEISDFIRLLRFCLYVNGYGNGEFGGGAPSSDISKFQSYCALPATGIADLSTWLSLMVSYGDQSRTATACDTRFEITPDRIKVLKANGYGCVGRYLIGGDFKEIRPGELGRLFEAGIRVFPIYQSVGNHAGYFTATQGASDAKSAIEAALKHGVPAGAIIYFAVDYDAMDADVTSNILPYFRSVHNGLTDYRVGIYGPRNVCSRVSNAGYAVASFVSDMSSGFSGNMGYRLPSNWAFDQIANVTITDGATSLEIDKDVVSGMDIGIMQETRDEGYIAPPPLGDKAGFTYRAAVNRSGMAIPVRKHYDFPGLGTIIHNIQPDETFITSYGTSIESVYGETHKVFFHSGGRSIASGYITAKSGSGTVMQEPWFNQWDDFLNWSSNGFGLAPATTNQVTINGTAYRVFTLQHTADFWYRLGEGQDIRHGLLEKGVKLAQNPPADMGGEYFTALHFSYWNPGFGWFPFRDGDTKVEAFVDLGLQYGGMPGNRLIR
ncbi:glycoside hydrolase domain-containing protein [Bifidobacterium catulorum]|uniref:Rv2525c-like glycoside hydrolase-like domain-containing protein n=1 Tax=Bifidobacterium catulorum TaxID=1630173 RepID=A0A2U2MQZ3_9BIFI|nr:glycoside hydrolase domain-containing protein [Bifidobacterium catulorum]PWG59249.1 hypothetical protein DF200_08620 [Bifidobacterium catulorum]